VYETARSRSYFTEINEESESSSENDEEIESYDAETEKKLKEFEGYLNDNSPEENERISNMNTEETLEYFDECIRIVVKKTRNEVSTPEKSTPEEVTEISEMQTTRLDVNPTFEFVTEISERNTDLDGKPISEKVTEISEEKIAVLDVNSTSETVPEISEEKITVLDVNSTSENIPEISEKHVPIDPLMKIIEENQSDFTHVMLRRRTRNDERSEAYARELLKQDPSMNIKILYNKVLVQEVMRDFDKEIDMTIEKEKLIMMERHCLVPEDKNTTEETKKNVALLQQIRVEKEELHEKKKENLKLQKEITHERKILEIIEIDANWKKGKTKEYEVLIGKQQETVDNNNKELDKNLVLLKRIKNEQIELYNCMMAEYKILKDIRTEKRLLEESQSISHNNLIFCRKELNEMKQEKLKVINDYNEQILLIDNQAKENMIVYRKQQEKTEQNMDRQNEKERVNKLEFHRRKEVTDELEIDWSDPEYTTDDESDLEPISEVEAI
jgi:hypothetical protein